MSKPEAIAVGTDCPLCGGHFFMPEPKYSKLIQQLVRVARAAKYADDVLDRITQSFPDNEVPHPSIEECLNTYCDLHKALEALPDDLLEVVK